MWKVTCGDDASTNTPQLKQQLAVLKKTPGVPHVHHTRVLESVLTVIIFEYLIFVYLKEWKNHEMEPW